MKKIKGMMGILILCMTLFAAPFSASAETEEHQVWTVVTKYLNAVKKSDVDAANRCYTKTAYSKNQIGSYHGQYMKILRQRMSGKVDSIRLESSTKATASVTVQYYSMKKAYLTVLSTTYYDGGSIGFSDLKGQDSSIRQALRKYPATKRTRKVKAFLVKKSGAWRIDESNDSNLALGFDLPYLDFYAAFSEFLEEIPVEATQS